MNEVSSWERNSCLSTIGSKAGREFMWETLRIATCCRLKAADRRYGPCVLRCLDQARAIWCEQIRYLLSKVVVATEDNGTESSQSRERCLYLAIFTWPSRYNTTRVIQAKALTSPESHIELLLSLFTRFVRTALPDNHLAQSISPAECPV